MTEIDPYLEVYEPTFEEISNSESPYYDRNWFESDLLPEDHEWYDIIGQFLLMSAKLRSFEYTGKDRKLSERQKHSIEEFKSLTPEIEDFIRDEACNIKFADKWANFCRSYDASGAIKREQKLRQSKGKFDRGNEQRRAWYAVVFLKEKAKGKTGPVIKRDIALFAELIRAGEIKAPSLWDRLKFYKILHDKSSRKGPKLNNELGKEMNVKTDIPRYAEQIAPKYELPPFEIKTSDQ